MLRTSIHTATALALTLFTPACDDPMDADFAEDAEDADELADAADDAEMGGHRFRCYPQPCVDPPMGNTNWAGGDPMDTVTQGLWNVPTRLTNGRYMQLTGAACGAISYFWKFDATAHGELVFWRSSTGGDTDANKVRGTAVQGCKFYAQFAQTSSMAQATSVTIYIDVATSVVRADGSTGYKYMLGVSGLNVDLPVNTAGHHPTCYDNADANGNYYMTVRPGLKLDTSTWTMTADSSKQSWVCAAGAFGHFALKNVDVEDISGATLATTEGRAWGLYHDGASHTWVGNPIRIHHPTIQGYDSAPNACESDAWYREALWGYGGLMCRGSSNTSWTDEISRNAWSKTKDWDDDSSVANVGVCGVVSSYDFETYAQCYMNGDVKTCPANDAC